MTDFAICSSVNTLCVGIEIHWATVHFCFNTLYNYLTGPMRTKIYGAELEELVIEVDYPDSFVTPGAAYYEKEYSTDRFLGEGTYKETFFEGIHIGYGDFLLSKPTVAYFDTDMETVEMHFALSGQVQTTDLQTRKQYNFSHNEHNIMYAADFKGQSTWSDNLDMEVFEINILPSLFIRYLPEHLAFEAFRTALTQQQTGMLTRQNRPINARMRMIIHEIMHCERTEPLKKMLVEARVIELLLLQLEQMIADQDTHQKASSNYLKRADVDRMYAVRDIIEANLSNPYSLSTLAKQVGTNEFTLKKGFKSLFGTTVFGYLHERQMMQARDMLLEEKDKTVTEVSEQCGYQYPSHFTTAFKRRFGVLPSKLKHRCF